MDKIANKPSRPLAPIWSIVALAMGLIFMSSASTAEKYSKGQSDQDAIRAMIDSYVTAYNRGDAKAVATHWSDTGEWTSPEGKHFQGRAAIEQQLGELFAANKGLAIEVLNPVIRLISSDVAVEKGTVRVTRADEDPDDSTYVAIHVKKNGHWKLDSVHETSVPAEPCCAKSPLQDLAWLVGDWVDQNADAKSEATVTWTKNKTFLNYSFKLSAPNADDLEGTQVIGWDPVASEVRSWMFDSDGGFGEGTWSKKDDSWIVKFRQVLADGRHASATNIYTLVDSNTLIWKSVGRKLDGEYLPNIEEVKMVRKTTPQITKHAD